MHNLTRNKTPLEDSSNNKYLRPSTASGSARSTTTSSASGNKSLLVNNSTTKAFLKIICYFDFLV